MTLDMAVLISVGLALGVAAAGFLGTRYAALQKRHTDMMQLAIDAAHKDFDQTKKLSSEHQIPLSVILAFYFRYFEEIEKDERPSKAVEAALSEMRDAAEVCLASGIAYYSETGGLAQLKASENGERTALQPPEELEP